VETVNTEYELSGTPIKDASILGTPGRQLCDNIHVYWLTEVTEDDRDDDDDDDTGKPTVCRKQ